MGLCLSCLLRILALKSCTAFPALISETAHVCAGEFQPLPLFPPFPVLKSFFSPLQTVQIEESRQGVRVSEGTKKKRKRCR